MTYRNLYFANCNWDPDTTLFISFFRKSHCLKNSEEISATEALYKYGDYRVDAFIDNNVNIEM